MSLFKKMVAVIGFERESHVVAIKRLVFFVVFFYFFVLILVSLSCTISDYEIQVRTEIKKLKKVHKIWMFIRRSLEIRSEPNYSAAFCQSLI